MKVFVLFHCDAWKSFASMRFIGVCTKTQLKKTLRAIKKECKYSDEDMETYIYIKETELNNISEMDI